MKKSKFPMLAVICFYVVVGIAACIILFLRGSSLSGDTGAPQTALYEIKPELSETASIGEEESSLQETDAPEPESSDAALQETAPETVPETVPETEPQEEEPVYYAFTTLNTTSSLHVRESDSMKAKVIARLSPGVTGYVLEKGPVWSLIQSGDLTGYVFNEYLEFREIPKEEFPAP